MRHLVVIALLALAALARPCVAADSHARAAQPAAAAGPREVLWMEGVENAYARWFPDGRRILYQSNRGGRVQLHVMNRDGSADRCISDGTANDRLPDLSPDGRHVAFVSDRGGNDDVWVMSLDGGSLVNLSRSPGQDIHPYWTPDGSRILFNSDRAAGSHLDIYSVRPDGTDLKLVYADGNEKTCARLSPDGRRIVYLKGVASTLNDEVFAIDADGTHDTNLTRSAAAEGWPTWTRDGSRIVYASNPSGRFALWCMNGNGTDARPLFQPPAGTFDARPEISPDGRWLLFNRKRGSTIGIFVAPFAPARR